MSTTDRPAQTDGWLGSASSPPPVFDSPGGEPQTVRPQPPDRTSAWHWWHPAAALLLISVAWIASPPSALAFDDPKNGAKPAESPPAADIVDLICLASKRPIVIRLHISVDGQSVSDFHRAAAHKFFEVFDADKNGVLEKKELASLPTPQMLAAAGRAPGALPEPADCVAPLVVVKGQVTPEAWARFLFPDTASPLSLASPVGSSGDDRRRAYSMMNAPEGGELAALLSAIDTNHDGRLSVAELARADELFRIFDLNDDDQISRTELQALLPLGTTFNLSQAGSDKTSAPLEVIPRTDKTALVRKIIETFGADGKSKPTPEKSKPDKPKPEKSTPEKSTEKTHKLGTIPAACIPGADKNGDGRIDEAELADWLSHPEVQCELAVALAASSLQEPNVKLLAVAPSARDAGLSVETPSPGRTLLRTGDNPLELRGAESSRRIARTSRNRALFKRADQNKNGYLERSEIAFIGPDLNEADFDAMDRHHNGMVFEDEWLVYLRLRDTLVESRVSLSIAGESIDPIAEFDANHDGRLSRAEFARLLAAIAAWDRNHDGFVTPDEVPKTLVGTFAIGSPRAATVRSPRSSRMKSSQPATSPGEGPIWFQKMDRDHDGVVSLREFLGPLSVFRRLDTNGDGVLDAHEAEAAQK